MLKAYKYRIYPYKEQKIQMAKTFDCCRFVYNQTLAYRKHIKNFQRTCRISEVQKKTCNYKSYTTNFTNGNIAVDFEGGKIKLPKLKEVKAKVHRKFTGRIKSATISQAPSRKYFVSVLVETEHGELPHTEQEIGLDLGIKDFCITSGGEKYENPKTIKRFWLWVSKC